MRRSQQSRRGAASVEAAISMIIIVPAFLYALFLDDLLRYAADLQEAVLSTPWDFTGQNYAPTHREVMNPAQSSTSQNALVDVQHFAREMFCDHESSGDSYDRAEDCDKQTHHEGRALSGHVCWLNKAAEQVTCNPVKREVGLLQDKEFRQYQGRFGEASGMYECHGKEVVENYLMPKTFLQKFSHVDLSKENWKSKGSDYHGNAEAGTDQTAYYLEKQHFALVTDSWALNGDLRTAVPGDSLALQPKDAEGDLYERVEESYQGAELFEQFKSDEKSFRIAAEGGHLLEDGEKFDKRTKPHVSLKKSGGAPQQAVREEGGSVMYFNAPWKDGSRDAYEKTGQQRGQYYMGCKNVEGCG